MIAAVLWDADGLVMGMMKERLYRIRRLSPQRTREIVGD
jgi:hypothetical protein